jgi:toxin ParE1/3/4
MTYEVLLLPRAQHNIDQILRYLTLRSPQGAIAWKERWEQVLDELRIGPLACGVAPESAKYEAEVRQILFKTRRGRTYRALFAVVGTGVFILHVRAPGQNLVRRTRQ